MADERLCSACMQTREHPNGETCGGREWKLTTAILDLRAAQARIGTLEKEAFTWEEIEALRLHAVVSPNEGEPRFVAYCSGTVKLCALARRGGK